MNTRLLKLPLEERIRLVEDLWDSIAYESATLPLNDAQRDELDRRLDAYERDGERGRPIDQVLAEIRRQL